MSGLHAVPVSFKAACAFVDEIHRHHVAPQGDKFRVGVADEGGVLRGVAMVGRPVSRYLDAGGDTVEVIRLCTDGTRNACSFLYSRAARIAQEMGYRKIITYILDTENGSSLKASGWHLETNTAGGGEWSAPSRPRQLYIEQLSLFDDEPKQKYPVGNKQRWAKDL